jgi:predicted permease
MRTLFADLQYAMRQLHRSPVFAITAVLTLTMAIGANVVVFGVMNAIVLHPLPVPDSRQVYSLTSGTTDTSFSYPDYEDIRDSNKAFSDLAVARIALFALASPGRDGIAQPVFGYEVSGNYFRMLGVQPELGSFFTPGEDTKVNGEPYAVLSYDQWRTQFGGDRNIVGKTVKINKYPFVVVGVAPRHFNGTERIIWPAVWVPVHDAPEIEGWNWLGERRDRNEWIVGRMRPGVTAAQANADLANVGSQLARQYPRDDKDTRLRVSPAGMFADAIPARAFLTGIMLMAMLVLFAACANLGGLFTARMADRARELGIRVAIGASRVRLLRQLVTESVFLALIGGAAATVLAAVLLHLLSAWRPGASFNFPVEFLVDPDPMVYLFAVLLALFTGMLFGILPARQVWRTDPNQVLKSGAAGDVVSRRISLRDLLLVVQLALCCLLVTSSLVALRGLARTMGMPLGFQPDHVTFATTDTNLAEYKDSAPVQQRLLDAVTRIPGVESVALANTTPLFQNRSTTSIYPPGATDFNTSSRKFEACLYSVGPGYFQTAGTRLLSGRDFTAHDDGNAPSVAIVNEAFAKQLFGTVNAVGKTYPTAPGKFTQVIGIVEDGKYGTLTEDPTPAVFHSIVQEPNSSTTLLIRSLRPSSEMIPAVRRAIAGVDPALPIFSLVPWRDSLAFVTFPARASTVALGVLGALAMMLAITGIFGLASYTVSRRMRELGIRVALGAQNRHVLRAALGRSVLLLGIGSIAGLALGFAASRVLASIVYEATASDPLVILGVVATMAGIGLVSAAWPARRALSAEPAMLLREE